MAEYSTRQFHSRPTQCALVVKPEVGNFSDGEVPKTRRRGLKSAESSKSASKGGERTLAEAVGETPGAEEVRSLVAWIEGRAVTRDFLPLPPSPPLPLPSLLLPPRCPPPPPLPPLLGFPIGSSNCLDLGVTRGDGPVDKLGDDRTDAFRDPGVTGDE